MKTKLGLKSWGWLLAAWLLGSSLLYAWTIPAEVLEGTPEAETGLPEVEPLDTVDFVENAMGLNLQMVYVRGGSFEMGATPEQGNDAYADEYPVHTVTLDDFYIGRFEVTQWQWMLLMGAEFARLVAEDTSNTFEGVGADYPTYYVSWERAALFCERLSAATGRTYRLPTEAEWEYAARGGRHHDGTKYSGDNNSWDVAWRRLNSEGTAHPVGQKKPNGLGLYDMSGNVWEWCSDWYDPKYYSVSPSHNPKGPETGSFRVKRGGSWRFKQNSCRVSRRFANLSDVQRDVVGLRVVCEP